MTTDQCTLTLSGAPFGAETTERIQKPEATPLSLTRKLQRQAHRRTLLIGAFISVAAHAALVLATSSKPVAPARPAAVPDTIELTLPPVPPAPEEDLEMASSGDERSSVSAPGLPALTEVPSVVPLDSSSITMAVVPGIPTTDLKALASRFSAIGAGTGNGIGGSIFRLSDLDESPRPVVQVPPQYPKDLLRARITGEVTVQFVVDAHGNVVDPHVVESTRHDFDRAALQAIAHWRFRPGKRGGKSVATLMEIPIGFSLSDE